MRCSTADRAADLMHRLGDAVLPLPRAAELLGLVPAELEGALAGDARFLVLQTAPALETTFPCPPAMTSAYTRALERIGLAGTRLVLLVDPAPVDRAASPADLLRRTLAVLVRAGADHAAVAAAEAAMPITEALRSTSPRAAGPSTTPPPPALPPAPAPRPWRQRSRRRPPGPGSQPG